MNIIDASGYLTRDHCGNWPDYMLVAYTTANAVIVAAYCAIPFCLLWLYRKRRDAMPKSWVLLMFSAFIFACGVTHATDIIVFWWPGYRLFTVLTVITAAVSLVTAATLPFVVYYLAHLPTPREFERVIQERDAARKKLKQKVQDDIAKIQGMIEAATWVAEQNQTAVKILDKLDSIKQKYTDRDPLDSYRQ